MSSLDILAEALRGLDEAVGARQAAAVEARALSAQELLDERAAGRVWFTGLLRHQWDGMRFGYAAKRWLLGDQVGLGKTRTMIGWTDLLDARRIIVVCQAEIVPQFCDEILAVAPHRRTTLLAKQKPAVRRTLVQRATAMDGIVVVNFELFRRDQATLDALIAWQPDTVIVDEAHNLKSTSSANYRYVERLVMADNVCPDCGKVIAGVKDGYRKPIPCAHCGWRIDTATMPILPMDRLMQTKSVKHLGLTTGTPILNTPEDVYPLLHLIDPIRFPFKKAFTEAFCFINYAIGGRLEWLAHGIDQLRPMIAGNYLARTREDAGIVLPPQRIVTVDVPIDPETHPAQARVVRQIAEQAKIELESGDAHTIMHAMTWITRKRQSVVWPAGITVKDTDKNSSTYGDVIFRVGDEVTESAKFDALCANIAVQHARGARQIVFSQFKTALSALENRLHNAGYRVARFDGDTSATQRAVIKEDFYRPQGTPQFDVVLVHYRSGGTGLNLQQATVTHILDEEWNPGRIEQAYGRTQRMGQTQETEVYRYVARGRGAQVDTWMSNLIRLKARMIEQFDTATDADKTDMLESLKQIIVADAA